MSAADVIDMVPGYDPEQDDDADLALFEHVELVELYLREAAERVELLRKQMSQTTDREVRTEMRDEIEMIKAMLAWLPDAKTIPAKAVTFGSDEYCRGKIWMPKFLREQPDDLAPKVIHFRGYKYTTSNPIEIAKIRVHIASGAEPKIKEIPDYLDPENVVPLRINDQFVNWTDRESFNSARLRGIGVDALRY